MAEEFAALLTSLRCHGYKFITPTDIKATVGRFKREFSGRDQQVPEYRDNDVIRATGAITTEHQFI